MDYPKAQQQNQNCPSGQTTPQNQPLVELHRGANALISLVQQVQPPMHRTRPTFVAKEATDVYGNVNSVRALVIEDIREADVLLRSYGHDCDCITHNELLSSSGTECTGKVFKGD